MDDQHRKALQVFAIFFYKTPLLHESCEPPRNFFADREKVSGIRQVKVTPLTLTIIKVSLRLGCIGEPSRYGSGGC
jgi:hypothetical protein